MFDMCKNPLNTRFFCTQSRRLQSLENCRPPKVVHKTLLCRKFSVSFKNEFMRVKFCHLPFGNMYKSPVLAFQLLLIIFSGIAYIFGILTFLWGRICLGVSDQFYSNNITKYSYIFLYILSW